VTIGFVGHPNVGKTSLLNAFVGRKVASVSRTPGHTKHLQTWSLSPTVTVCDSPGLVFPVAGALVRGVNVGARAVYEACGLFPIAQIRETYSAVRLLHASQDLIAAYGLQHAPDLRDEPVETLSPHLFCTALAERKGYRIARGKGALDLHRAGLEVLKDCVDGALCLAFDPPPLSELGVASAAAAPPPALLAASAAAAAAAGVEEKGEEALREVLEELRVWAGAQRSRGV
jgi:ribosome biogenesis GTPase A